VIDLLEESERLLQNVEISTQLIETSRGKALTFESDTVLGFIMAYENCALLIERWSADMGALVAENQLGLRRAQSKAWNTYTVFLAMGEANYAQKIALSSIEENLTGTRKLARAGVDDSEDLRAALLPLLPIQHAPHLEPVDMSAEIKLRTTELPTRVIDAFLAPQAPETSVVQILEEEAEP
jgi:hypothetical protein